MIEEEIMIRAREAYIACHPHMDEERKKDIRSGAMDRTNIFQALHRALCDASKPLSAIQPVDPDLIEARECLAIFYEGRGNKVAAESARRGNWDDLGGVRSALLAIKRAKERTQGGAA